MIAEKRKARSLWQKTHFPQHKQKLNQISNKLKLQLYEIRNKSFQTYTANLSIWKPFRNRRIPTAVAAPIRKYTQPPTPWARSDHDKAELFAEYLQEVFTTHDNTPLQEVNTAINELVTRTPKLKPFTLKELCQTITTLKTKKAPGIDLMTTEIIQRLPTKAQNKLFHLYNATLRLKYWPPFTKDSPDKNDPKAWEKSD
jgi:hypothetical protein